MKNKRGHIGQYSVDLIEREEFNWQSFRVEAAKDILCAMIQGGYDYSRTKSQSELAIKYVDELIKALKYD